MPITDKTDKKIILKTKGKTTALSSIWYAATSLAIHTTLLVTQ